MDKEEKYEKHEHDEHEEHHEHEKHYDKHEDKHEHHDKHCDKHKDKKCKCHDDKKLEESLKKIKELEEKTAESLTAFKAAQKNILNEQYINLLAKDRMFNNNYSKDIKQYGILSKELKQIDGVLPTLYGKADKIEELCSLIRKRRELNSSRTKIGKRINAYKTELTTNNEKYNSILNQLKKEK